MILEYRNAPIRLPLNPAAQTVNQLASTQKVFIPLLGKTFSVPAAAAAKMPLPRKTYVSVEIAKPVVCVEQNPVREIVKRQIRPASDLAYSPEVIHRSVRPIQSVAAKTTSSANSYSSPRSGKLVRKDKREGREMARLLRAISDGNARTFGRKPRERFSRVSLKNLSVADWVRHSLDDCLGDFDPRDLL